jgi:hypothetical protein
MYCIVGFISRALEGGPIVNGYLQRRTFHIKYTSCCVGRVCKVPFFEY